MLLIVVSFTPKKNHKPKNLKTKTRYRFGA
jgi:hypothetical protein